MGRFGSWIERLRNIQRHARLYRNRGKDLNESGYYDIRSASEASSCVRRRIAEAIQFTVTGELRSLISLFVRLTVDP
jgi:hypothetical protein